MSVLGGPGEGTWSVFAVKAVEMRDKALEDLALEREAHHNTKMQLRALKDEPLTEKQKGEIRTLEDKVNTDTLIQVASINKGTICCKNHVRAQEIEFRAEQLQMTIKTPLTYFDICVRGKHKGIDCGKIYVEDYEAFVKTALSSLGLSGG